MTPHCPSEHPQVAGLATAEPTDTITIPTHLFAIPADPIDPPTIAMIFGVNDSPLGGREGKMLTSAVIAKRLEKEAITNVALRVQPAASEAGLPEATEVCMQLPIAALAVLTGVV